ncbi:hypothetical protein RRG08_011921 [Elysia crispata]|uniref:Uncharacterized protein n=1 Tax=Elysia crispata TaxID=231223 RepID=A0AAE0Y8T7_9GAST|nr:hypothetical protein RRG08_011921 [Elysia crispata]
MTLDVGWSKDYLRKGRRDWQSCRGCLDSLDYPDQGQVAQTTHSAAKMKGKPVSHKFTAERIGKCREFTPDRHVTARAVGHVDVDVDVAVKICLCRVNMQMSRGRGDCDKERLGLDEAADYS